MIVLDVWKLFASLLKLVETDIKMNVTSYPNSMLEHSLCVIRLLQHDIF